METQVPESSGDGEQLPLFSIRSELAAVSVETVLEEIAKLKQLRALGTNRALIEGKVWLRKHQIPFHSLE